MKWPLEKLRRPTLARNTDSSSNAGGLIWHKIQLTLQINKGSLEQDFFTTRLGQEEKVILGHPWLTTYNPTINWISRKVTLKGDTPPRSPTRSSTPQQQHSPGIHPYCWIVPPHLALGGRPWRSEIKKWRMELQPEEFTNEPYLANVDHYESSSPTHEMVSPRRNNRRRRQ